MWNLKDDTSEFIYLTETDSQMWRADFWLPQGEGTGEGKTESLGSAAPTITYRMQKQQGPTGERKEQYSVFCDKP